jgi:hypothetical protein
MREKKENKHESYVTAAYILVFRAMEWKESAASSVTEGETDENGKHLFAVSVCTSSGATPDEQNEKK